jgi:hypothetical protein
MAKITLNPLITGISGTLAGVTFQTNSSGTIAYTKPYFSPTMTQLRRLLLDSWREAKEISQLMGSDSKAAIYMQCELFPRYLKNISNFEKSALDYAATIIFYNLISGLTQNINNSFAPIPTQRTITSVIIEGASLLCLYSSSFTNLEQNILVYASKPYSAPKPYLSRYTTFMQKTYTYQTACDIGASYLAKFGRLPVAGEYICLTSTFYDFATNHILPDVTNFYQVTEY